MTRRLIYGDRSWNLDDNVADDVVNQLQTIVAGKNGVGLLRFAADGDDLTILTNGSLPLLVVSAHDYDVADSIG